MTVSCPAKLMVSARLAVIDNTSGAPSAVGIRLLTLTVCGLAEIQKLRWEYVDLEAGELRLCDAKKGPSRTIWMATPARAVLAEVPRRAVRPWVYASARGEPVKLDPTWHTPTGTRFRPSAPP